MKKTKLIGIAAIAMALIIAFSGVPVASRPCRQDRLGFFQHKQTASISASTPKMDCNV